MGTAIDRIRTVADDFLRIVGIGGLVAAPVTALGFWAIAFLVAYLGGLRDEWLIFGGGVAAGIASVFLITVVIWRVRRAMLSAAIKAEGTTTERGYLDHKIEQAAASRALLKLMRAMTGRTRDIGAMVSRGNRTLGTVRYLPVAWRDRGAAFVANWVARKLHTETIGFSALADDYEYVAKRLRASQDAYLNWALGHGQGDQDELAELRKTLSDFRDALAGARDGAGKWVEILAGPNLRVTSRMIGASEALQGVLRRIMGISDGLSAHLSHMVRLIDDRLTQ